jgi:hypothetical protein
MCIKAYHEEITLILKSRFTLHISETTFTSKTGHIFFFYDYLLLEKCMVSFHRNVRSPYMCESIFEFIGPQYSTNGITGKLD